MTRSAQQLDHNLAALLRRSAIVRFVDGVVSSGERAAITSTAVTRLRQVTRPLRRDGQFERRHLGLALVIAAVTHIGLATLERPAGWLWLVPPALVVLTGMLLIASAPRERA